MQELLLAAVVGIMGGFGGFLMKRLDCFLEKNHQAQEREVEFMDSRGGNKWFS